MSVPYEVLATGSTGNAVVIDGQIGYTGGMNINDHYFRLWRDTHMRITGDAVAVLQYTFLDSWLTGGGTIDKAMIDYYPMAKKVAPATEPVEAPGPVKASGRGRQQQGHLRHANRMSVHNPTD